MWDGLSSACSFPGPTGSSIILSLEMETNPFKELQSCRWRGVVPGGAQTPCLLGGGCAPRSQRMLLQENTAQQGGHLLPHRLTLQKLGRGSLLLCSSLPSRLRVPKPAGSAPPMSIVPWRGGEEKHRPVPTPPSWAPSPHWINNPSGLAGGAQLTSGSPVPPSRSPPAAAATRSDTRDTTRRLMGSSWERADRPQPRLQPHGRSSPPPPAWHSPPSIHPQGTGGAGQWAKQSAELPPRGCGAILPLWVDFKLCF